MHKPQLGERNEAWVMSSKMEGQARWMARESCRSRDCERLPVPWRCANPLGWVVGDWAAAATGAACEKSSWSPPAHMYIGLDALVATDLGGGKSPWIAAERKASQCCRAGARRDEGGCWILEAALVAPNASIGPPVASCRHEPQAIPLPDPPTWGLV